MSTLTSHLVTRDPAQAAAWYGSVLGAVEEGRVTLPGGRVLTIDLRFGDSRLAIGDEFPDLGIVSPLTLGGTYGALHLAVEDADAVWQSALDAGAKVFEPLHDAFWGDRTGQFIDPFGHRWAIDQHLRDVPPDEVARLAAEAFGEGSELMRYRLFGPTGLRVSELFLGAMTFGEQGGVGAPPEECARILDAYAEAGGNVVDTASNYRGGAERGDPRPVAGRAAGPVRAVHQVHRHPRPG